MKSPDALLHRGWVELLNMLAMLTAMRHKAMATSVLWGTMTQPHYILSAAARKRLETSQSAPRSITFSSSVKPPTPPFPSIPSSL